MRSWPACRRASASAPTQRELPRRPPPAACPARCCSARAQGPEAQAAGLLLRRRLLPLPQEAPGLAPPLPLLLPAAMVAAPRRWAGKMGKAQGRLVQPGGC